MEFPTTGGSYVRDPLGRLRPSGEVATIPAPKAALSPPPKPEPAPPPSTSAPKKGR